MHEGCSGSFKNGKQIVDQIRMMGFNVNSIPVPLKITCSNCSSVFQMTTMEDRCPNCGMVYGVTPCHASSADNVMPAGIGY